MKNKIKISTFVMLLIFMATIISCEIYKERKETTFFSLYNENNILTYKNIYKIEYSKNNIVIFNNKDKLLLSLNQFNNKEGVFRKCGKDTLLSHSFLDNKYHDFCKKSSIVYISPFINSISKLIKVKEYYMDKKKYNVFLFEEHTGQHKVYYSYYCNPVGFFIYYNFDVNKYIKCDSVVGNISKNNVAKYMSNKVINDSAFFIKYKLIKHDKGNSNLP